MDITIHKVPYELKFDSPPPSTFRNEFADFTRNSLKPENFPGLSTRPPPDGLNGGVIVCRFNLKGSKRRGPLIPCSMCNYRPKFLDGALFWFPQDKCIRLIGNCCALHLDEEASRRANNNYDRKIQFENDCSFLEKNLKLAPSILSDALKMSSLCETIMHYRNELKTMSGVLAELRKALKIGGKLNIEIPIEPNEVQQFLKDEGVFGQSEYKIETVHILHGLELINSSVNPLKDCQAAIIYLQSLALPNEDSYDEMLLDLVDDMDAVINLAKDYRNTITKLHDLHHLLNQAVKFFSDSNLEGLKKFGSHRHTHQPFGLSFDGHSVRFELRDRSTVRIFKRGAALKVPAITLPDLS